jgi:hypothetical protein
VLWIDLTAPSEDEAREVGELFGLRVGSNLSSFEQKASLLQENGFSL